MADKELPWGFIEHMAEVMRDAEGDGWAVPWSKWLYRAEIAFLAAQEHFHG